MTDTPEKELCIPRGEASSLIQDAQDANVWLLRQLDAARASGLDTAALERQAKSTGQKLKTLRRLYGL